ncbi:nitrate reductase cytochrome c-type subunit [Thalassotalea sp. HSM 43]|uniref:nitrate reductase cytochrome c-type subunit n=1 Tax=Thalassotalea sp. HSM 43 TaxID=2552945 RepID=UPI001081471F|nr:nitrate reductase cytochrome c-type subunit [Thalassotalea sp. HSM 43]QBY03616.1 nitrate reductase cytochrome c-type subunit [Thalassotalea sp. HSM 43]
MKRSKLTFTGLGCVLAFLALFATANEIATLRDATALDTQQKPEIIPKVNNDDVRRSRAYPMQPPLIPHKIDNYQVDLNVNKCMSCHSRNRTEDSQAPMVSVTHYMDRDGNFLAEISPRRYFCNQCHVVQYDTKALVENQFVDMNKLIQAKQLESSKKDGDTND